MDTRGDERMPKITGYGVVGLAGIIPRTLTTKARAIEAAKERSRNAPSHEFRVVQTVATIQCGEFVDIDPADAAQ
jgi:hypothetical protein